jgi:hypothetical protein
MPCYCRWDVKPCLSSLHALASTGRLPSKQDEVTLAEECVKLAPLLGAVTESRKFTLAK